MQFVQMYTCKFRVGLYTICLHVRVQVLWWPRCIVFDLAFCKSAFVVFELITKKTELGQQKKGILC